MTLPIFYIVLLSDIYLCDKCHGPSPSVTEVSEIEPLPSPLARPLGIPPLTDLSLKCRGIPTQVTVVGDLNLLPRVVPCEALHIYDIVYLLGKGN